MPSRLTPEPVATTSRLKPRPLAAFKRLSSVVSLHEPHSSVLNPVMETSSPLPPTTILLCCWTNAVPKHVDYYARTYMRLYPSARIILVSINSTEFLIQSETKRRKDISSAVTAILSDKSNPRILAHCLSNGGARRLYGIAGAYQKTTSSSLPVTAIIFDSAPGIPQFRRDIHALMIPARKLNWMLWIPFAALIVAATSVVFVVVNWLPKWVWRELVWGPIDGMSDEKLLRMDSVRGYVYSEEDKAIDWRHVEKYAAITKEKGSPVLMKKIIGAEHAQMFRGKGGEEAYWGFIEKVWGVGSSQS